MNDLVDGELDSDIQAGPILSFNLISCNISLNSIKRELDFVSWYQCYPQAHPNVVV